MIPRGMVALDLDGVLIRDESSWGIYHKAMGTTGGQRDINMRDFFSGKIDYGTWAMRDAALWKGRSIEPVRRALPQINLTEGALDLVEGLRSTGVLPVIISTGISEIANRAGDLLGIDTVVSNEVEVLDGKVTGRVRIHCGFGEKGSLVREMAERASIPIGRCAAVGDAENDLPMFRAVPLSIAFNPRSEEVARAATVVVRDRTLHRVREILVEHLGQVKRCIRS